VADVCRAPIRQPGCTIEANSLVPAGTLRIHELTAEERGVYDSLKLERMPEHVAIIMDGNGRWAGSRALKRFAELAVL